VLVHPLGAGRSPTDELGRKRRMTQFILRLPLAFNIMKIDKRLPSEWIG